jgi:hypothetical protein
MICRPLLTSFPTPEKEKRMERREREREKEIGENARILEVLLPLPPQAMAEQDWTPSTVLSGHLQKLVKQGFMTATEFVACHVREDPAIPTPKEGYVVSFMAFYERGFDTSSHWFLYSLLWHYGLELHHLTPSWVLDIATFVTLCEAYLGIDPNFDLWNYFFHVQRPQDPEMELMISGGVVIHVKSEHGVDTYLEIPMPRSMKGWRKKWF